MVHGFRLDLSACAYCAGLLLLIWMAEAITGKNFEKLQKVILIISLVLIALITIADAELFRKWGNKFNSQVLVYVTHPLEMALSAGAVNWLKTFFFLLGLTALFIFLYVKFRSVWTVKTEKSKFQIFFILVLSAINFILIRGGTGVATISQSSAIYSDKAIENAAGVNSLWNALYYIVTNTDNIYGDKLNYMSQAEAERLFREQLPETADTVQLLTTPKPNVMIILLESFTANASHLFSGHNNCTPYLDSIARQNLSFMKCYSSGDRTEKGLVSVVSGYPAQPSSSIIVFPDKMSQLPSLSKTLKKQGYHSMFMYGGDAEFASMKSYLVVQQFDDIIDKRDFKSHQLTSKWGAHDHDLYKNALENLNKIKPPFLSVIMTLSSHEPFDVPHHDDNLKKDEWYGLKNAIEYADQCLFKFLEDCKKQPWYKETIIVLVADHGHDIGLDNVHYFGPEKYHIPLIITGGALNPAMKGKKMENYVSQTVIPQLLLQQMKLPAKDFNWQTGAFDNNGFAQYLFNNGVGRINNEARCIFDNESGRCYYYKGAATDSAHLLNQAKAYQQVLVKDFLSK